MSNRRAPPTAYLVERRAYDLAERFRYDPLTGDIFDRGKKVQTKPEMRGYTKIYVGLREGAYRRVYKHRLAWFLATGDWPNGDIDHINRKRDDDRLCNLRTCERYQNTANRGRNRNNKSGFKGVCLDKYGHKYRAYIMRDYRQISLGVFDTAQEAHAAYLAKATELFGEFASSGAVAPTLAPLNGV